ncbi:response regulator [Sphingomonas oryzagri]|uniref:Response regulator n=1 Tax=Sphingomonas oryzagri TaxID=3042314 RepID=A0ABT6N3Z3_9SPHN|nr:response regulator [Sphingomonas oryzagri]MDH7639776.1 response regulator [Sphingomonas oryzagri]
MDNRPSILIVDDEPSNRSLARGIASAAGWRPDEAESGEAAVNAARAQAFTLILMDVQMPGIDGFAATRAIRAGDGPNASTPILAFTAVPPGDAIERGRAAGMDGHIAKPFTPETLLAAIDPWRPHGGPSPAAPLIAIFGEAEIAGLLARFRSQLVDALAADEPAAERRARAHKIAGISGTLGFVEVSQAWLAVSEGDESAWDGARIAARRAIRQIDTPAA